MDGGHFHFPPHGLLIALTEHLDQAALGIARPAGVVGDLPQGKARLGRRRVVHGEENCFLLPPGAADEGQHCRFLPPELDGRHIGRCPHHIRKGRVHGVYPVEEPRGQAAHRPDGLVAPHLLRTGHRLYCPEFTSLCPMTGQPDFAAIYISYVPDQKLVESKSLKLYLFSFRNHGDFHEDCVNIIMKDLIKLMEPKYIEVWGKFTPRGGLAIDPYANYGKPGTEWEAAAKKRLMMHDMYPENVSYR